MAHYTPRPVWVNTMRGSAYAASPTLGLLLDWKQVPDKRGHMLWWALVAKPRGGGPLPAYLEVSWLPATSVAPAEVVPLDGWPRR